MIVTGHVLNTPEINIERSDPDERAEAREIK
jgi:hypothetical protein